MFNSSSFSVAHPTIRYIMPEANDPAEPSGAAESSVAGESSVGPGPGEGDVAAGLSPDALLAYCQSRLDSIDGQARASLDNQQRNASTITHIDQIIADFKTYDKSDQKDPAVCKQLEASFGALIHSLKSSDPGCSALPALTKTYNSMVWSGDGGAAFTRSTNPTDPDFIDVAKYPPDTSTPKGDNILGSTELQGYVQTLSDAAGSLNSDSELQMIQLQSLMSQRQTAISLTTNLVQSLGDQENKIAQNIGH